MRVHTSGAKKQRPGGTSRGDTAAACLRLLGLHLFPKALLCQMLGLEQVTEVLSLSEPCWEIGLLRAQSRLTRPSVSLPKSYLACPISL